MIRDVLKASAISDSDHPLGLFAVDMMLDAGQQMLRHVGAEESVASHRFISLTAAFNDVRCKMKACAETEKPEAHAAAYEALVRLASESALLATRGDEDWHYDPKKVRAET
jgi:hypothetical protein